MIVVEISRSQSLEALEVSLTGVKIIEDYASKAWVSWEKVMVVEEVKRMMNKHLNNSTGGGFAPEGILGYVWRRFWFS